jgi:hypothetical protein
MPKHDTQTANFTAATLPAGQDPLAIAHALHIPLSDELKHEYLRDVIIVFDAMLIDPDLRDAFPDDLRPATLHGEILGLYKLLQTRGQSRTDESSAVEVRKDALKRGQKTYDRVLGLIDASTPPGTPGRSGYFPTEERNPTLGDLLIAAGRGVSLHGKPKLPEGWTGASLQELGTEVNTALVIRARSGKRRKGVQSAVAASDKRIAEVRKRLRDLVTNFLGRSNPRLVEFGITPRAPTGGGRRKK